MPRQLSPGEFDAGVIAQLRPRYLDLVNREADYSARYGANHQSVVNLRNQIREQMRQGASEQQIKAYMVARYGDFVLYTPPFKPTTETNSRCT